MAVSAERYQIEIIGIGTSSYVDTVVYVPSYQLCIYKSGTAEKSTEGPISEEALKILDQSCKESWSHEETIKARNAVELKTRVKIEVSDEVVQKIDALVTTNLGVASGSSEIKKEIQEIILHSDLFV